MSVVCVGVWLGALSGSAILGFFFSAILTGGKVRDLERAYLRLSQAIRALLRELPAGEAGFLALADSDISELRLALNESDEIVGWTIEDWRR